MVDDNECLERISPAISDAYFVVDKDRRIVASNRAFSDLLGARSAERRRIQNTQCHQQLNLEICKDRCIALACLKKGETVRMHEVHGETANGRSIVLELTAMPLRTEAGETSGVLVVQREVTDERRLKQRFLDEQAERASEREALLRIIQQRDAELQDLRAKLKLRT